MRRLLALALALAAPAAAHAAECPGDKAQAEVRFSTHTGKVVLHNEYDRDQIRRMHEQQRTMAKGWHPIGLTRGEIKLTINVNVRSYAIGKNKFCSRLTTVETKVGHEDLHVYIASRYRPGTCQHQSILAHEQLHVRAFEDAIRKHAPRMEGHLRNVARGIPPLVSASPESGAERFKERMQKELQPFFRDMNRDIDAVNATIDSEENYRREQTQCPSW
ncbi:MAG: hypothetical protein EXQ86_11425 [Rhodospirillales bacterium]|nr:hypothetical protein [Rhodospirillales bacterium]